MTGTVTDPWATRELGIELVHTGSVDGCTVPELVEPGLRRNPRRAHLLVSTVLGKHLPATPAAVLAAGNRLGDLVVEALGGSGSDAVVLGFAETATGLGHCVAARIGARCYLHSTRRHVRGAEVLGGFEEGHSHATSHMLQPSSAELFDNDHPLVLVDDEISTGATAIDAMRTLNRNSPRPRYVIASLVDLRTDEHHSRAAAAELGAQIESVSLATGRIVLPDGLIDQVSALPEPELNLRADNRGTPARLELPWPQSVPDGGRHGFLASDVPAFERAVHEAAEKLASCLDSARPVIVVGHEEFMYLPLRIAEDLADRGLQVRFQTTTRSPAYVLDEPGYPLRRGFRFNAPEVGEAEPRYLYNAQWPDSDLHTQVVAIVDRPADTRRLLSEGGLVDVLTAAGTDVLVAVVPGVDPVVLREHRQATA